MEKRVLLVEDDLDLRDSVQDILESEGYEVIAAANGRQALDYLRSSKERGDGPSVLVLDLMMPIVSGWQVLEAIQEDPDLELPVIVVSASGSARPDGVAAYLRKPFDLDELLGAVHESS